MVLLYDDNETRLYENHLHKIKNDSEAIETFIIFFVVALVVCLIVLVLFYNNPILCPILVTLFAFLVAAILAALCFRSERSHYLYEQKIRQREEELKNISDSLNLFYMPLHDLLKFDKDFTSKESQRKIARINCNMHLAREGKYTTLTIDMKKEERTCLLNQVKGNIQTLQDMYRARKKELDG